MGPGPGSVGGEQDLRVGGPDGSGGGPQQRRGEGLCGEEAGAGPGARSRVAAMRERAAQSGRSRCHRRQVGGQDLSRQGLDGPVLQGQLDLRRTHKDQLRTVC